MPITAYLIIADGSLDQICETKADAAREARDLKAMGCRVRVTTCPWDEQDEEAALIERLQNIQFG